MEKNIAKHLRKLLLMMALFILLIPSNRTTAFGQGADQSGSPYLALATLQQNQERSQPGTSFSVRVILPQNQEREESTFFDLRMEPGQEQIVNVEVINHTRETIEIEIAVFTATTNRNGFAEYQLSPEVPDSTLPHLMEELITVTSYVEIPPEGAQWVPIHIQMPEKAYNGVLAGGIEMRRVESGEQGSTGGLRNVYSFLTVILLHQGEAVSPQMVSLGTKVEFSEAEGLFSTNFQNTQPAFASALEIHTIVTNRETKEVIFESKTEGLQMVPHSNFWYPFQLSEDELSEGIYIINYILKSGDLSWELKEHIRITGESPLKGYAMSRGEVLLLEWRRFLGAFLGLILLIITAIIGLDCIKRKR